jgi:hypothetical protein
MDIVVWLRSLGLGKYEATFRENDIDETVLPSLTHQTLKELGVASIGHRVKLLDAKRLPSGILISERRAPVPVTPRSVSNTIIGSTSPVGKSTLWLVAHNYNKLGAAACFRTWPFV